MAVIVVIPLVAAEEVREDHNGSQQHGAEHRHHDDQARLLVLRHVFPLPGERILIAELHIYALVQSQFFSFFKRVFVLFALQALSLLRDQSELARSTSLTSSVNESMPRLASVELLELSANQINCLVIIRPQTLDGCDCVDRRFLKYFILNVFFDKNLCKFNLELAVCEVFYNVVNCCNLMERIVGNSCKVIKLSF